MTAEDFKRRFLPFHPKLYRIAFALVGNSDDAEDILQEAYSKLWMKREELEVVQNPEAFCVTLIKNVCLDYLRSPRANRHEDGGADHAMRRFQAAEPGRALRGLHFNGEMRIAHRNTNIPSKTRSMSSCGTPSASAIRAANSNVAPGPFPVTRLPSRSVRFPV